MDAKLAGPLIGAAATILAACIWVWGSKLTSDDKPAAVPAHVPPPAGSSPTTQELQRLAAERAQAEEAARKLAAERKRLEDAVRRSEAERAAEARRREAAGGAAEAGAAPANFSGTWVTEDGEVFVMIQGGRKVRFEGTDEDGASVAGEGLVTGREVVIRYVRVDQAGRSGGEARLRLSTDGQTAKGSYTNETFGLRDTMTLTRTDR